MYTVALYDWLSNSCAFRDILETVIEVCKVACACHKEDTRVCSRACVPGYIGACTQAHACGHVLCPGKAGYYLEAAHAVKLALKFQIVVRRVVFVRSQQVDEGGVDFMVGVTRHAEERNLGNGVIGPLLQLKALCDIHKA